MITVDRCWHCGWWLPWDLMEEHFISLYARHKKLTATQVVDYAQQCLALLPQRYRRRVDLTAEGEVVAPPTLDLGTGIDPVAQRVDLLARLRAIIEEHAGADMAIAFDEEARDEPSFGRIVALAERSSGIVVIWSEQ